MKNMFFILIGCCTILSACRKKGCTDSVATNYSAEAKKEDGSCIYAPTVQTLSYGSDAIQTLDLYLPPTHNTSTKVIVMVHGGGWVVGYNETEKVTTFDGRYDWDILNKMLDEGFACAVIKYRTACYTEDHTTATNDTYQYLNQMVEDLGLSIDYLKANSTDLGISDSHFQLLGESAGSQIVLSYGLSSLCDPSVKSILSMYAPTSLDNYEWKYNLFQLDSITTQGVYAGGKDYFRKKDNACVLQSNEFLHLQDELISFGDGDTLFIDGVNQYLQDLSPSNPVNINHDVPTFIMHGEMDNLVPFSQANLMYDALTLKFGNGNCAANDFNCHFKKKIYTNCGHSWSGYNCQKITVINDIVSWLNGH